MGEGLSTAERLRLWEECGFDAPDLADVAQLVSDKDDTIDGLTSDLEGAVEVAFKRGATEWVRLNYPKQYETLIAQKEATDA